MLQDLRCQPEQLESTMQQYLKTVRIIHLHISPINVSVHATDPQLHCTMLGNKNAARSLDYIQAFCKAGIVMNGQIVVCPGWNDGDQLRRSSPAALLCRWVSPSTARVWPS